MASRYLFDPPRSWAGNLKKPALNGRRTPEMVMGIIKDKATATEIVRSHDLTVGEAEQWMNDFVSLTTEALRTHPGDAEARHKVNEKELLAPVAVIVRVHCSLKDSF